jgi:hypothetical protein
MYLFHCLYGITFFNGPDNAMSWKFNHTVNKTLIRQKAAHRTFNKPDNTGIAVGISDCHNSGYAHKHIA